MNREAAASFRDGRSHGAESLKPHLSKFSIAITIDMPNLNDYKLIYDFS
jgi:hypothetical protein